MFEKPKVGEFLLEKIQAGSKLSFVSAYFTIYAYEAMREKLESVDSVRFTFTQAKSTLTLFQKLCAGKTEPYQQLCDLFDQETGNGRKMETYDALLRKAVASITETFRKRMAAGLTTGRSFVLPVQAEQARSEADFELITWLVIRDFRFSIGDFLGGLDE